MITYAKDELVGITELGKSLGSYLDKVVSNRMNKLAIIRHNKPEAVIVPIDEYEYMKKLAEYSEYLEIEKIINERDPEGNKSGDFDFEAYHKNRIAKRAKNV